MLEGLAAWVLNTYVGEYVENLNTDQLSIALLQGAVELENLPLKRDALKGLDLPLEVKSGFIGKITLQIPVRRLRSEPWTIFIERLYLVAGPLKNLHYDQATEKKSEDLKKEAMLEALEAKWKVQKPERADAGGSWFSYGTSVAANIMENLQLNVKDVHFRYEDDQLNPSCPFACGVTIKSLSAQSTDGTWIPKFVSRNSVDMMHKLVDLQNFSLYFNTDTKMVGHLPMSELSAVLQQEMCVSSSTGLFQDYEYILAPVSAQAKMKRNTSVLPLRSSHLPRISLDLKLEKMAFCLGEDQYRSLILWLRELERHDRKKRYIRWRPSCSVMESPRQWWKFSITTKLHFIQEQNQRSTKEFMAQRARDIVWYHKAYMAHLSNDYMDRATRNHKTKMERDLTFEELRVLRELAFQKVKMEGRLPVVVVPEKVEKVVEKKTEDKTLLQRWFPGWGGWYGGSAAEEMEEEEVGEPVTKAARIDLEQEILDVLQDGEDNNTLLKRDVVFANLNFCLETGAFKLVGRPDMTSQTSLVNKDRSSLLELECSAINMMFESRPRTSAMTFGISVGDLVLKDHFTENSNFPSLVMPQTKTNYPNQARSRVVVFPGQQAHSKQLSVIPDKEESINITEKLFEFVYEKHPTNSKAQYRIKMQTKPLDIVYNQGVVWRIQNFFSVARDGSDRLRLTAGARRKYETLKRQTRAELRHTIEQLLEGEEGMQAKRWDIQLDISAPQIIIPENFTDPNTPLVVLDFGNFRIHNTSPFIRGVTPQPNIGDDNEDEFATPMSTPPGERESEEQQAAEDLTGIDLNEPDLYDKLYDKYTAELSDLQVMVGRMRDNWRHAHFRGSSHMHVVDRFSITLQIERRLIYTTDSHWPGITVCGTLPTLTVHVNEQKVHALRNCLNTVSTKESPTRYGLSPSASGASLGESISGSSLEDPREISPVDVAETDHLEEKMKAVIEDSCLLMSQFSINQMSLEIHSKGRAIAELQVSGVKANMTKKPYNTSVLLSVHSLLVVDALQTYGPDFELLVASHKSLCLDSKSGSLIGSNPSSPKSPASPCSPESPVEDFSKSPSGFLSVQEAVTKAFQTLVPSSSKTSLPIRQNSQADLGQTHNMASFSTPDTEALISFELEVISPNAPSSDSSEGPLQIASLQFNSLDVIANQETVIEIMAFVRRILPPSDVGAKKSSSDVRQRNLLHVPATDNVVQIPLQEKSSRTSLTADFHRLNVLLMRLEDNGGITSARKVATATMSCARVQATLATDLSIEGSLGGFHVIDVTLEGAKHQRVFSVGHEILGEKFPRTVLPNLDMYKTAHESFFTNELDQETKALSFQLRKPGSNCDKIPSSPRCLGQSSIYTTEKDCPMVVTLKMASLCYTHSPRTLHELSECLSEFREFMTPVASSIKDVAAEVALGIVGKKTEGTGFSLHGSAISLPNISIGKPQGATSVNDVNDVNDSILVRNEDSRDKLSILIDVMLESPVIVIPRNPTSSEVLVAHLGQISVRNSDIPVNESAMEEDSNFEQNTDKIYIGVKNMNVYSVDVDSHSDRDSYLNESLSHSNIFAKQECGIPILHNTSIEIMLTKTDHEYTIINPECSENLLLDTDMSGRFGNDTVEVVDNPSVIQVDAKISTPLKLVLSKDVYEQLLQTVDNLTYDPHNYPDINNASRTAKFETTTDVKGATDVEPSVSALKMEEDKNFNKSFLSSKLEKAKAISDSMTLKLNFQVPLFNVEMRGDFGEGEQGLVDLKLHEFIMEYEKNNPHTTKLELYLKSLIMEDLLESPESAHRHLMLSKDMKSEDKNEEPKLFLSRSCPDSTIITPIPVMPPSLPSSFHEKPSQTHIPATLGTAGRQAHSEWRLGVPISKSETSQQCPCTPPPTPQFSRRHTEDHSTDENLVHISVVLVDKKSPDYVTKYNKTNRFIDVDFNCLETTINLQTWVVLLDFLGMGAKIHDVSMMDESRGTSKTDQSQQATQTEEFVNSEVNLKVKSLSLLLNKPEYELALAAVSKVTTHVSLQNGNFAIVGQLGSVSLQDQSPHGELYRERFVTIGNQALEFDIFKFGIPDPHLQREHDIRVKLRMASVRYIHTNRFQSETLAFCQHFLQLQDVLGRMRAASAGKKISDTASIGARISMDIVAGSPIILIPHSSRTTNILVANLGNLTIQNTFLFDGDPGTLKGAKEAELLAARKAKCSLPSIAPETESVDDKDITMDEESSTRESPKPDAHVMTQSMFNDYFPPRLDVDPMTQSIIGDLDKDIRNSASDSAVSSTLKYNIYDPTEIPSPMVEGTSVDPLSPIISSSKSLPMMESVDSSYVNVGRPSWSHPSWTSMDSVASSVAETPRSSVHRRRAMFAESRIQMSQRTLQSMDSSHQCLLDVMDMELSDIDLYSAERVAKKQYRGNLRQDLEFASCVVQRKGGRMLKETCMLKLQVERNLEGDISHAAPDWHVSGALSSVHCSLDISQYKLIKGILDHNLGEKLEEFQTPLISHLQDPYIQTVLSGMVWRCIAMAVELNNVTVELLQAHSLGPQSPERSLAKLDFIRSTLVYDSFSDQSKDVDLVSHEIVASDTRFRDSPTNLRPSVFEKILQSCTTAVDPESLQMELHYRSSKQLTRFTVLLNNMKLMCIFDWLLTVQEFLLSNLENPFQTGNEKDDSSLDTSQPLNKPQSEIGSRRRSPLTTSGGIITKRGPVVEQVEVPFELKLNVTETQFVVVEDSASWDTNAVILKSTAVMSYRPNSRDKILSCSLQSLEVFSCSLVAEEETALSIIDPMTISIELNANPLPEPKVIQPIGLLDAQGINDNNVLLEINFNTMNIRLSYHDMKMFLAILNSLPQQALSASQMQSASTNSRYSKSLLRSLEELGFTMADCMKALDVCKGDRDEAAIWLLDNAKSVKIVKKKKEKQLSPTGIELKATCVCLCLIDDCRDADVPLAELSFNGVSFHQKLEPHIEGRATFQLLGDYYNRSLSGWEPFLEPWRCNTEWKDYKDKRNNKLAVQISASDVMNLNLTSACIEQYQKTKMTWTEDYYRGQRAANMSATVMDVSSSQRRRNPFIPFVLKNQTGCVLWFLTVTVSPSSVTTAVKSGYIGQHKRDAYIQSSEWTMVSPNEEIPFVFYRREKIRHKKTHELHVNQLVVKVDGWQRLTPVSVDKVGIYFRYAEPDKKMANVLYQPARVVFDVCQEDGVRKVITVRSALLIHNRLDSPVDVRMESTYILGQHEILNIAPSSQAPVPLPYVGSRLWTRPSDWPVGYCSKPVHWNHVMKAGEINDGIRVCETEDKSGIYRFCVSVKRENYPEQPAFGKDQQTHGDVTVLPAHTITLVPPVVVMSLLPIDMYYYMKGTDIMGTVKPGKMAHLHAADLSQAIELGIQLENFETCRELVIPPGTTKYKVKLRIYDSIGRLLELVIRITAKIGGSLWLTISAPYWLVNKSGLPLVFRQDGARTDSAGQFEEHELARSLTPLLFSFADKESANLCSMRIGKSVHGPVASPQWCHRFSLESGVGMRQLHVVSRMANRPDWVYNIGIKVQQGRGRYRDTNIVTFAPRFQIDNQSSHKLAIAQRHLTKDQAIPNPEGHLTALPKCKLPFHWPRLDLDQLLCVKLMDQANIRWSGGFRIDRIYSSHINMRDDEGNSFLLKVEVVLQGPTFFIVFADAEEMPPPFRIDNFSEVPIMYYQTSTVEEELKSYIKPHTNLRYAWDEPTLDPFITLSVRGGTSGTYNMNKLEEGEQLCYENFIFLGATATFNRQRTAGVDLTGEDLVMDCIHNSYIVFRKKEVGKRSQFWRMTSHGMLEHEGSAPPRDPRKSSTSLGHSMVLDIADIAPQPGKCVPLTLRKPDERRCSTQTWRFTNDGRLCCAAGNLSVQAMGNLQEGAVAVLGPGPSSDSKLAIPEIMQVSCQKSRPGSGLLSVRVHMDGPVRVLQITDICNRQLKQRPDHEFAEWQVYEETSKTQSEVKTKMEQDRNIEVSLQLKGIGLSLVNQQPEELLYALLRNIMIDYTATPTSVTVDASVANIQVDNQLFGTQRTVMLHITPTSKSDVPDNTPALHIAAQRVPHNEWNADIYKYMVISMKKLTLQLEERLLWKLLQFIGFGEAEGDIHKLDDKECDSNRALVAATSVKTKRYYFGILKINTSRVTLSMLTASKLSADLESIKHALSVPLIRFEEAKVDIDPFIRHHPFETSKFLFQEVLLHYTEELKSQAAKILGSVDFLGNPLGLFNDVTEGISGLIKDGNVGGLLKNVTHGVSNSAAKVASSLSDGVGKLNFDSKHNDAREVIRNQHSGSSGGHLVAGVKGLGYGFVGGLTSIFTQTYEGVKDDGIEGLFTGFGKGLVGTVTKPVTGVLDLASGAAHAVRDTSRSTSRAQPPRMREPRCCYGPGGLLPLYSRHQAAAQKVLHIINKNKFDEFFIAMEQLRGGREDNLHALISSKKVYFLRDGEHDPENIVLMVSHDELLNARQVETNAKHYIEMVMKGGNGGGAGSLRRPQVRCDKQLIAQRVSQQVNYAKNLFDEHNHTLLVDSPQEDWD